MSSPQRERSIQPRYVSSMCKMERDSEAYEMEAELERA